MGEFGLEATTVYGAVGEVRGAQARAALGEKSTVGLPGTGEANEPRMGSDAARSAVMSIVEVV